MSAFRKKQLGKEMIKNIIINTIVPILFAYGLYHQEERYKTKALHWLEDLSAENNSVIKSFSELKISCKNAFDTQALVELKTNYCDNRKCLNCSIGSSLLKST